MANPLTPIFEQARIWIIDPERCRRRRRCRRLAQLLPAAVIYVAVCVLGVWVFNREAPKIAEQL